MTGYAVVEAARDLEAADRREGHADGRPGAASRRPRPARGSRARSATASARTSSKWKWTPSSARVRVTKYVAVHESGRIMNPLTATGQIQGAAIQGIGMALHEDLLYDRRTGQPLTRRLLRRAHPDAPRRARDRGHLHRDRRRLRAVRREEHRRSRASSCAPAAVGNAIFNAIGRRMKDLPITRDRILGALA